MAGRGCGEETLTRISASTGLLHVAIAGTSERGAARDTTVPKPAFDDFQMARLTKDTPKIIDPHTSCRSRSRCECGLRIAGAEQEAEQEADDCDWRLLVPPPSNCRISQRATTTTATTTTATHVRHVRPSIAAGLCRRGSRGVYLSQQLQHAHVHKHSQLSASTNSPDPRTLT